MARPRRRKQLRAISKATRKRIDHIAPDFVTTWTSRSADRRAQVFGSRTIFVRQTLHGNDDSSRECAAPTSMDRRKRTRPRIANQYRHAVSRLHTSEHVLRVTDDHVAVDRLAELIFRRLRLRLRIHHAHVRAVHLPATGERPLARKKLEKATAILQNVRGFIVVKTREAERILRHRANATVTRRKTIYKTVLLQRPANKRAHAVELAPIESSST